MPCGKGGTLHYKCRKCGTVYDGLHVPSLTEALVTLYLHGEYGKQYGGMIAYLYQLHPCNKRGEVGIADLIGGVKTRTRRPAT